MGGILRYPTTFWWLPSHPREVNDCRHVMMITDTVGRTGTSTALAAY